MFIARRIPIDPKLIVCAAAALASATYAGAASATPLDPNSYASLGALSLSTGNAVFNTTTGAVTVNSVSVGSGTVITQANGPDICVFDFDSISLASGASFQFLGSRPAALLSRSDQTLAGRIIAYNPSGGSASFLGSGAGGAGATSSGSAQAGGN